MDKSELMSIYNKAKSAARSGKLDPKRVNRAFGILLSKDCEAHLSKYSATTRFCTCEDHRRGSTCKHMIARMMQHRIMQQHPYTINTKGDFVVAEQINSSSYRLHIFPGEYDMRQWINSGNKAIYPGSAKGKRLQNVEHGYTE